MYKINKLLSCVLLLALFFSSQLISAEDSLSKNISKYINELTQFSCNFIQSNPDGSISEGSMIYSENKIRVNCQLKSFKKNSFNKIKWEK